MSDVNTAPTTNMEALKNHIDHSVSAVNTRHKLQAERRVVIGAYEHDFDKLAHDLTELMQVKRPSWEGEQGKEKKRTLKRSLSKAFQAVNTQHVLKFSKDAAAIKEKPAANEKTMDEIAGQFIGKIQAATLDTAHIKSIIEALEKIIPESKAITTVDEKPLTLANMTPNEELMAANG